MADDKYKALKEMLIISIKQEDDKMSTQDFHDNLFSAGKRSAYAQILRVIENLEQRDPTT